MNQVNRIISTYSADVFGAISALFELGGMIVVHDPSGCNSTYTTHDEPRWFNSKTLLYISALTEMDAVLGNDARFIKDVTETALLQKPKFIALIPAQMPAMLGIDMNGIAKIVEKNTGIKTFALNTTSMQDYSVGISFAFSKIAEIIVNDTKNPCPVSKREGVNILGLTPLDFALNDTDKSIVKFFEENKYPVISTFAMNTNLENLQNAHNAACNIVVSNGGLKAAKIFEAAWNTPYIVGLPIGSMKKNILQALNKNKTSVAYDLKAKNFKNNKKIYLIHESVIAASIATALEAAMDNKITVVNMTEPSFIREGDLIFQNEAELEKIFNSADIIIADPMYKPIISKNIQFISLPHVAFSGRTYRKSMLNLTDDFGKIVDKILCHILS